MRSALPDVTVVEDDGTDPKRAAALAATADVAVVVVGYTRLDEGEYIGEFATAHLAHLFPGEDDPALVERFTAQIADERTIEPPRPRRHPVPPTAGSPTGATARRCTCTTRTWPSSGPCRPPTRAPWWRWWPAAPW